LAQSGLLVIGKCIHYRYVRVGSSKFDGGRLDLPRYSGVL
jgi:hypothetical protein